MMLGFAHMVPVIMARLSIVVISAELGFQLPVCLKRAIFLIPSFVLEFCTLCA